MRTKHKNPLRRCLANMLSALGYDRAALGVLGLPVIAGGEASTPQHPLDPPTLSGNRITVDLMLQQPTRITTMIRDLTLTRFIADRIFTSGGGVTGGAIVYDQATGNDWWYTSRDVQEVQPGTEFPIVTDERPVPRVERVRKYGGKTFILDEAKDRNNGADFAKQIIKLSNTIVRKINARAVEVLEAAIAEHSRTVVGNNWSTVLLEGNAPTAPQDRPTADFAAARLEAEVRETGIVYDTWIVNPQELTNLVIGYGEKLAGVLDANGIREMYSSNRVAAGTAYAVAAKQVGEMRVEKPLYTIRWYEEKTERTWVQSGVRPVMVVTDPFSVLKFTGLAG